MKATISPRVCSITSGPAPFTSSELWWWASTISSCLGSGDASNICRASSAKRTDSMPGRSGASVVDGQQSARDDKGGVSVTLAQHELASLIGVSRNSVVRALTILRSRHLVTTDRRTITVVDVPALRRR